MRSRPSWRRGEALLVRGSARPPPASAAAEIQMSRIYTRQSPGNGIGPRVTATIPTPGTSSTRLIPCYGSRLWCRGAKCRYRYRYVYRGTQVSLYYRLGLRARLVRWL